MSETLSDELGDDMGGESDIMAELAERDMSADEGMEQEDIDALADDEDDGLEWEDDD